MTEGELSGVSSMATRHVLADLAEAAAAAGLARVAMTSIGGVTAAERVAAGEPFDIVVLDADALARLADNGHVDAATVRPLVISQVGIAAPAAGGPADTPNPSGPAFSSPEELAEAITAANGIGYSTGPSGLAVLEHLRTLGVYDDVEGRLVQARPGVPVASLVASGEVSLGFQQMSELLSVPGVRVLGHLPRGLEISSTFSAAIATLSAAPQAALDVLQFWDSPEAAAIKSMHHFTSNGGFQ